jgi:hypothetical protein
MDRPREILIEEPMSKTRIHFADSSIAFESNRSHHSKRSSHGSTKGSKAQERLKNQVRIGQNVDITEFTKRQVRGDRKMIMEFKKLVNSQAGLQR